jgi:hypothetical protein
MAMARTYGLGTFLCRFADEQHDISPAFLNHGGVLFDQAQASFNDGAITFAGDALTDDLNFNMDSITDEQ